MSSSGRYPFYKSSDIVSVSRDGELQRVHGRKKDVRGRVDAPRAGEEASGGDAGRPATTETRRGLIKPIDAGNGMALSRQASSMSQLDGALRYARAVSESIPDSFVPMAQLIEANLQNEGFIWPLASVLSQTAYDCSPQQAIDVRSLRRWADATRSKIELSEVADLGTQLDDLESVYFIGIHEIARTLMLSCYDRGNLLLHFIDSFQKVQEAKIQAAQIRLSNEKARSAELERQNLELKFQLASLENAVPKKHRATLSRMPPRNSVLNQSQQGLLLKARRQSMMRSSSADTSSRLQRHQQNFALNKELGRRKGSVFDTTLLRRITKSKLVSEPRTIGEETEEKAESNESHKDQARQSLVPFFVRYFKDVEEELGLHKEQKGMLAPQDTCHNLYEADEDKLQIKLLQDDLKAALDSVQEIEDEKSGMQKKIDELLAFKQGTLEARQEVPKQTSDNTEDKGQQTELTISDHSRKSWFVRESGEVVALEESDLSDASWSDGVSDSDHDGDGFGEDITIVSETVGGLARYRSAINLSSQLAEGESSNAENEGVEEPPAGRQAAGGNQESDGHSKTEGVDSTPSKKRRSRSKKSTKKSLYLPARHRPTRKSIVIDPEALLDAKSQGTEASSATRGHIAKVLHKGKRGAQRCSLRWLRKTIHNIYHERLSQWSSKMPLGDFIHNYLLRKYGIATVANQHFETLVVNTFHHQSHLGINTFLRFLMEEMSVPALHLLLRGIELCRLGASTGGLVEVTSDRVPDAGLKVFTYEKPIEQHNIFPESEEGHTNWVAVSRLPEIMSTLYPETPTHSIERVRIACEQYKVSGPCKHWENIRTDVCEVLEGLERVDRDIFLAKFLEEIECIQQLKFGMIFQEHMNADKVVELPEFGAVVKAFWGKLTDEHTATLYGVVEQMDRDAFVSILSNYEIAMLNKSGKGNVNT